MKRFLLFSGQTYYPHGGWNDFDGSFDTADQAQAKAEQLQINGGIDWWQVIDGTTGNTVVELES